MFKKQPGVPYLDKWLLKERVCPWEVGTFRGSNPVALVQDVFNEFCEKHKPNSSKKELYASWALSLLSKTVCVHHPRDAECAGQIRDSIGTLPKQDSKFAGPLGRQSNQANGYPQGRDSQTEGRNITD